MSWYAAHILVYLKYLEETQDLYDIQENIVLVEASDSQAAWTIADELGKKYESDMLTGPEKKPARWTYGGIRVVIECQDVEPETLNQPPDFKPKHATEVTYLPYTVKSVETLNKLIKGEAVDISLEDSNRLTEEEREELLSYFSDTSKGKTSSNPKINRLLRMLS